MADTTTTLGSRASVRYLRVSPSKVRQVLSLIRGLPAEDAERVLQLCERAAADDVFKLLESAIANAQSLHDLGPEELYVARAYADDGPTRKWGRPRARGRYARVRKRSSHVTIELSRYPEDELEARQEREAARSGPSADARRRRRERVARSRQREAEEETSEEASAEVGDADADEDSGAPVADAATDLDEADALDDDTETDDTETDDDTDDEADDDEGTR